MDLHKLSYNLGALSRHPLVFSSPVPHSW